MPKSKPLAPGIIIYDDQCRFCTRFAKWCEKKQPAFSTLRVRETEARVLLRRLGVQFVDLQTIYYIEADTKYTRSRSVFRILVFTGYPWKLITLFRFLPLKLNDFLRVFFDTTQTG